MSRGFLRALVLIVLSCGPLAAQTTRLSPAEVESVAEEAYVFAFPMLQNYRTLYFRSVDRTSPSFGAPFNQISHGRNLADPSYRLVVRQNNDTLYSRVSLDLRAEPVVITVPAVDDRYWSLQVIDLYTHNIGIYSARNEASTGTQYLVAGPKWAGQVPPGIARVVRSESSLALATIRLAVRDEVDVTRARSLQDGIRVAPLSFWLGRNNLPIGADVALPPFDEGQAQSEGFIRYVNVLLEYIQVHPSESAVWGRFSAIGIGASPAFDPASMDAESRAAVRRGVAKALERIRSAASAYPIQRGAWTVADASFGDRERMQGRYPTRSAAARRGLYGLDREEAVYMSADVDAEGQPLDGARSGYVLQFGAGDRPPARAFWSLTMYDRQGYLVPNAIRRYAIGDRTPGLVTSADGSMSIWISQVPPTGGDASNWLPAPAGPFALSLRMYLPSSGVDSYTPPPVRQAR